MKDAGACARFVQEKPNLFTVVNEAESAGE